ncbi:MAG: hypothetical protein JRH11_27170 [Deltaproteobacteria bacterium]|nr:hypothetical protein [Deltaproteobacteria bacterium]
MLPPFIIEQLREREERAREQSREEQPRLDLPTPGRVAKTPEAQSDEDERGPVEIQIW